MVNDLQEVTTLYHYDINMDCGPSITAMLRPQRLQTGVSLRYYLTVLLVCITKCDNHSGDVSLRYCSRGPHGL